MGLLQTTSHTEWEGRVWITQRVIHTWWRKIKHLTVSLYRREKGKHWRSSGNSGFLRWSKICFHRTWSFRGTVGTENAGRTECTGGINMIKRPKEREKSNSADHSISGFQTFLTRAHRNRFYTGTQLTVCVYMYRHIHLVIHIYTHKGIFNDIH